MRFRDEVEHEPCPHCGRNACTWHGPGRRCGYAYEDLPGAVKPRAFIVTLARGPELPREEKVLRG
jgi:hypothetical protein